LNSSNLFKPLLLLILFAVFSGSSCKKGEDPEKLKKLKVSIDSLYFERMAAWDSMINEDDKKIRYMGRLLDEINYQLSFDEIKMTKLRADIQGLSGLRYKIDELSQMEKVDDYDAATDSAIRDLMNFVTETPQASDIPLISELMTDIRSMDNSVLQRRNTFDDATMALNELIENNKKNLKKLGAQYSDMEPFPLFVIYPG
jgi:hypothetical protein